MNMTEVEKCLREGVSSYFNSASKEDMYSIVASPYIECATGTCKYNHPEPEGGFIKIEAFKEMI